jgi:hypothetical protein
VTSAKRGTRSSTIGAVLCETALVGALGTIPALALIGAILYETALVGALGTIPALALIGAVLYETALVGALGTIPALALIGAIAVFLRMRDSPSATLRARGLSVAEARISPICKPLYFL